MKSYILKHHNELVNKQKQITDFINDYEINVKKHEGLNSIITPCLDIPKQFNVSDNLLSGILYSLKDNVTTKGIRTTGGSEFLDDYIPPYDATLYSLLKQSGAILTSKCNLDQFGMAGTGIASHYGYVKSILDPTRIVGGSSSGSVNLVASKAVDFAIGTDTGDSVRRPASFVGVVGYKPTYGLISRYGVLPYAPSLDHVGIITNTVADAAIVADQICKFDSKDYTSQKLEHNFFKNLQILKKMKVSVIKGMDLKIAENERKIYLNTIELLRKNGHTIIEKEVNESLLDMIGITYQVISNVEGLSCYESFTGIPFGKNLGGKNYEDVILKNRTNFFNNQVKRRMILGAYSCSSNNFENIYINAKKMRTLLINLTNNLLDDVDCLLIPSASCIAPTITEAETNSIKSTHADDCLVLGNFAGIPSITIPAGNYNGMPFGININCKQFKDQDMFNVALTIEELLGGKDE